MTQDILDQREIGLTDEQMEYLEYMLYRLRQGSMVCDHPYVADWIANILTSGIYYGYDRNWLNDLPTTTHPV